MPLHNPSSDPLPPEQLRHVLRHPRQFAQDLRIGGAQPGADQVPRLRGPRRDLQPRQSPRPLQNAHLFSQVHHILESGRVDPDEYICEYDGGPMWRESQAFERVQLRQDELGQVLGGEQEKIGPCDIASLENAVTFCW